MMRRMKKRMVLEVMMILENIVILEMMIMTLVILMIMKRMVLGGWEGRDGVKWIFLVLVVGV